MVWHPQSCGEKHSPKMVTPGALDMTVLMKFVPLNWVDSITTRTIAQEQAIAIITHAIPQGVCSHNLRAAAWPPSAPSDVRKT